MILYSMLWVYGAGGGGGGGKVRGGGGGGRCWFGWVGVLRTSPS